MDESMLDGSAAAGVLGEVFAVEMTTATLTCGTCGATGALGTMHLFRGAGLVLRCPQCGNPVVKIVEAGTRMWLEVSGLRSRLSPPRGLEHWSGPIGDHQPPLV